MPADPRKPALALRSVSKTFGDVFAVRDLSLEVDDGEFLFLIGPSGCGKTTTLRLIGGYDRPCAGEIVIGGRVVNDVPLEKRNIGMVFQSYALFPHMSVSENVEFGLKARGVARSERRERVAAALDLVALSGLAARYPAQLSGGQRQRVALARAIVYEPDILLLDEPLANLDRHLRAAMRAELKRLQAKIGITTVYVTHDQDEALSMADRVAVLDQGRLLQAGTPRELYNRPRTPFVAAFLGEATAIAVRIESRAAARLGARTATGLILVLEAEGDIAPGERAVVSIRPERVQISPARPDAENVFAGTVAFVDYLGAHAVYQVALDDGATVVKASEPIPGGRASFAAGERVFVAWPGRHATLVRETKA